jgi:hypothetical protein
MLQIIFPDVKMASLRAYKSVWKKEQEPKKDRTEKNNDEAKDKPAAKTKKLDKSAVKLGKPVKKKDKLVKEKMLDKSAAKKLEKPTAKQAGKPEKKQLEKPVKGNLLDNSAERNQPVPSAWKAEPFSTNLQV